MHQVASRARAFLWACIAVAAGIATTRSANATESPDRIQANANVKSAGKLSGGTLTVRLEVREGEWHPQSEDGPSLKMFAFGEVGGALQIPGPMLRVREGTMVHMTVRNALPDSTLVLWGLHSRPGTGDDSIHVQPGATREVRFSAGVRGTYYYWGSTTNTRITERGGRDSQLTGAFIVDPASGPAHDRVFVLGLWARSQDPTATGVKDDQELMVINGKSWPHTERVTYDVGDTVRWRWINATESTHPMHLHGFYYLVDSRGSWSADTVYAAGDSRRVVTELMPHGGTMALRWVPERPGNWVMHCHFGFHVSQELELPDASKSVEHEAHGSVHRMAGLVLGIHVKDSPLAKAAPATGDVRRIRMIAQQAPKRYGDEPGLSFVVQEGAEPAPDSVTAVSTPLVLTRGQPVAITVVNRLSEATAVHWHGIELESFPDGVPNWSGAPGRIMAPIMPGDSFTAEFVPPRSGTFMYHSHSNELRQISSGLYGSLLVVEPGAKVDPELEKIILVGAQGPAFPTPGLVNGQFEPEAMDLQVGKTYRIRIINMNMDWRVTFTLRSDSELATWRPVAKDGADLPASQAVPRPAYLLMGPGETADFEFTPRQPADLRLDVTTYASGWHVLVPVRVKFAGP